jgi:hypothetical protein
MKALVTTLAVIEFGVGAVMLAVPSLLWTGLIGSPLSAGVELVIARLAAVALLALALACWLLRNEGGSRAMKGLVGAMLLFNGGAVGVLLYAGPGLGLSGSPSGRPFCTMRPWAPGASSPCSTNRPRFRQLNNLKNKRVCNEFA